MIKNKRVLPLEKVKEVLSVSEIQAITGVDNVYVWKDSVAQKHIDKLLIAMDAKAANATLEAEPAPIVDAGQPDVTSEQPEIDHGSDVKHHVEKALSAISPIVSFTIFKSPDPLSKRYWQEDEIILK